MRILTIEEEKMEELWDIMVACEIATNEEIGLAVALMGRNYQTLCRVLYIRTGYNSLEQIKEELEEDDYM